MGRAACTIEQTLSSAIATSFSASSDMKKSGERRKGQYTSPTETKEKGLQDTGENFSLSLCKGPPVTTTTLPLVDVCSLERGESAVGERWHLYHTHTGRLTGFLRERQRLRDRRLGKNNLQPPWRPPYTSHSRSPLAEDRGVKHQPLFRLPSKKGVVKIKTGDLDVPKTKESDTQSENTELSKKSNVKRENSVAKSKNSNGNKDGSNLGNESDVKSQDSEESEESGDEEGEESSSSTYTPWSSDISEDDEMEEEEEGVDNGTQQQVTEKHYSAREMLLQREEMRQKTLILTER